MSGPYAPSKRLFSKRNGRWTDTRYARKTRTTTASAHEVHHTGILNRQRALKTSNVPVTRAIPADHGHSRNPVDRNECKMFMLLIPPNWLTCNVHRCSGQFFYSSGILFFFFCSTHVYVRNSIGSLKIRSVYIFAHRSIPLRFSYTEKRKLYTSPIVVYSSLYARSITIDLFIFIIMFSFLMYYKKNY